MTVDTLTNRVSYQGDGTSDTFTFSAKFQKDEDLVVIIRDETDPDDITEETLVLNTDYTVTGANDDDGGEVEVVVPPTSTQKIIIYRDPDLYQNLNLVPNDKLPVEEVEKRLDKLTMIAQRLKERMNRAVGLAESFVMSFDPTFPADLPPNSVLGINSTGDGLVAGATFDEVGNAQAYAEAASDSADAAAASEAAAASSQSAAASSASSASTSATNASNSASSASTSASNAATSETNASNSASAAATSASIS